MCRCCWSSAIPTQRGLTAAERIASFRHDLDIRIEKTYLILNGVTSETIPAPLQTRIEALDIPLLGTVPQDEGIAGFDLSGRPLIELGTNSPVYNAVATTMKKVL